MVGCVGGFDVVVEYRVIVVYPDDVAVSGLDHSVADDFVLVLCAAEGNA
jgi:hypothetical protein